MEKDEEPVIYKGITIFDEFDSGFLKILSKVYKLRYYDSIKEPVYYGFLKEQVLGELDFTINSVENGLGIHNDKGESWKTPYKIDESNKLSAVFENNYILKGWDKKEYMERKGNFFAIYIDNNKSELLIKWKTEQG